MKNLNLFYGCCETGGSNDDAEKCGCGFDLEDCGCGSSDDMGGCGSGCGCGSGGCGGGSEQIIRIAFEDGTEYDCPVLSIFDINEQEYIALYHPEKQRALLYRFKENQEGVYLESIDNEEEFNLAANAFQNL